jgi:hypothetical protein
MGRNPLLPPIYKGVLVIPLLPFCWFIFKQFTQCVDKIFIGQWLPYSKKEESAKNIISPFYVMSADLQNAFG